MWGHNGEGDAEAKSLIQCELKKLAENKVNCLLLSIDRYESYIQKAIRGHRFLQMENQSEKILSPLEK